MRRLSGILFLLVVALAAAPSWAADNKAVAREAYHNGTRLYDLNRFKEALDEFEKAYLNYEDSAFLFNIAQCHRQLANKPEALKFYRTYLRKQPDAPNADQVRQVIADLEIGIKEDQARAAKPPVGMTPSGLGEPAPAPVVVTPPVVAPLPLVPVETVTTAEPQRKPAYKKWWVWTLVGVGVAAIAVGVGVGVTSGQKNENTSSAVHF